MEKITKREMYQAIAEAMETGECKYAPEVVADFCMHEIELLDKKAAKAKETVAKKRAAGDELTDLVRAALTDEPTTIADIAARIEGEDVTVAKVQYRLGQLAKNGEAVKSEVTIPATEGTKARKVVAYAVATCDGCCDCDAEA